MFKTCLVFKNVPETSSSHQRSYLHYVQFCALDVPHVTGSICDVRKLIDFRGVDFLKRWEETLMNKIQHNHRKGQLKTAINCRFFSKSACRRYSLQSWRRWRVQWCQWAAGNLCWHSLESAWSGQSSPGRGTQSVSGGHILHSPTQRST